MQYSEEFKLQVVKKYIDEKKTQTQVSRETGVSVYSIKKWVQAYQDNPEHPFVGSGNIVPKARSEHDLLKENRELREEVAILKKALTIFAKEK